jgi:predicted nucleic acid-binding Zn ribbon protein
LGPIKETHLNLFKYPVLKTIMIFRRKKRRKLDVGNHKFCPVCGRKLELHDSYCTNCGYSFEERHDRKKRKKTKLKNWIIALIVILAVYFSIRYSTGQSLFPTSLQDAISTFLPPKS